MKPFRTLLAFWLTTLLIVSAGTETVKIPAAEALIADKIQILDVRTEKEWQEGHLEGAVRVDFLEKGFSEEVVKKIDPKKPVLVYCKKGSRSEGAAKVMEKLGYTEIRNLDGGIIAWEKAGKKVVK